MPLLSFRTENNILVENLLSKIKGNLKSSDLVKNPFSNSVVEYEKTEYGIQTSIELNPIYPDFSNYMIVLAVISFCIKIFSGIIWFTTASWILIGLALIVKFAHSASFFKLILRQALRKNGYKGYIYFFKIKKNKTKDHGTN